MDKVIFSRSELYNLVWKFPIIQIARHYEISSMGIKNACEKMQIPLPGSRHWVTLEYKRKEKPALSRDYAGSNAIAILKKTYEMQLRSSSKSTPLLDLTQSIKADPKAPLTVPQQLSSPHPVIAASYEFWQQKISGKESDIDSDQILNLNVSDASMNRALLFMDSLIKLLEYRGHRFEKGISETGIVYLDNIAFEISLREALKRVIKSSNETSNYVCTGEFIFRIMKDSNKKEFRDGSVSIENSLALITAKLELMAAEEKRWKESCETDKNLCQI
ncbi:hypothetical protein [Flavobacterium gelatinilyticum]|uniref:hypothetical protein n=1 Tax=Flavobacterium gelatinilyticum TaxID=3003260 RepID=UPI002480A043|nr:hypothetical protein [Flavobacterium gelatinilyticum]